MMRENESESENRNEAEAYRERRQIERWYIYMLARPVATFDGPNPSGRKAQQIVRGVNLALRLLHARTHAHAHLASCHHIFSAACTLHSTMPPVVATYTNRPLGSKHVPARSRLCGTTTRVFARGGSSTVRRPIPGPGGGGGGGGGEPARETIQSDSGSASSTSMSSAPGSSASPRWRTCHSPSSSPRRRACRNCRARAAAPELVRRT